MLTEAQLDALARHGEERTAAVGDVLFRIGDRRYPFIAIREGEAAILDLVEVGYQHIELFVAVGRG